MGNEVNSTPAPAPARPRRRRWTRLLAGTLLFALLVAGGLAAGTIPRLRQEHAAAAAAQTAATTPPRVTVATAQPVAGDAARVLPGNALPLLDAALYARTTGYLKRRLVDIGDRVQQGQLLGEISAPDVDDQLAQARANVEQAKANLKLTEANAALAKATLARYQGLQKDNAGAVSQLVIDEQTAQVGTTTANVEAARATIRVNEAMVQRFTDLQGFQKIVAPFQGVITARNVDQGDLITADTPTTTKEMFHLMRTDVLRVWVNVPQTFSTTVKAGQAVTVWRREDPTRTFAGQVARTADALDPNSRTLLTEVHVPNPDNALRPGMYLQVKFTFDRNILPVVIPSAAVVIRAQAPTVAVLDAGHAVHYRPVQLGRDYGATVEVAAGLNPGEVVAVHPGDDLPEGTVVEPVPQPAK